MTRDDGRRAEAKAIPIMDVAARLGISGLSRAGVEHVGACPVCGDGGKRHPDRFAINPPRGIFICRQCDAGGDGLALVQFVQGCDFLAALDFLVGGADLQIDPAEVARRKAKAEAAERKARETEAAARARAIRDAREIWDAAQPGAGSPAEAYLAGRGIRFETWPPTLRFLPSHPYRKHFPGRGMTTWQSGSCMIAAVQDAGGRVAAVHQTWIDPGHPGQKAQIIAPDGSAVQGNGKPWPAKLVRGSKKGGAIRLSPADKSGRMVMGEGIETTASAQVLGVWPGATFWAGVDLGNMAGRQVKEPGKRHSGKPDMSDGAAWVPPEWVNRLLFLQDGDSDPAATAAKLQSGAIRARLTRPGLQASILPAAEGQDFNDMLQAWINQQKKEGGER